MRSRATATHQDVVSRRLELLHAELADPSPGDDWWAGHTAVPDDVPEPVVAPVEVPVPGRHAARRGTPLSEWLPEGRPAWLPEPLRGRVAVGPWHLVVVALVVVAALVLTCWWLVRGRASAVPDPVASVGSTAPLVGLTPAPSAAPAPALSSSSASPAGSAGSPGAMVTVDVEGKVRRPGIVIVPVGSRVTDALTAAGGVPHRRSLSGLNLAAVLVDGQQIVVGQPPSPSTTVGSGSASSAAGGAGLVDLNTATAEELDTLPGVGPVTAQSIIDWREKNGGFTSVQDLLDVDGIGPATLEKLTPHVTV